MEWPFSELFSANESLWNQYSFIAFYIFSGKILIIWYKILVATWNVIIFYRQELASLFQVQEKLKACRSSKLSFLSSCLVVNDSHEIVWLHVVVFSEHDILHFCDNVDLFKHYSVKVPQNCFNLFRCSNQTCIQVFKFLFALDK